jgi:hypothetical protein
MSWRDWGFSVILIILGAVSARLFESYRLTKSREMLLLSVLILLAAALQCLVRYLPD